MLYRKTRGEYEKRGVMLALRGIGTVFNIRPVRGLLVGKMAILCRRVSALKSTFGAGVFGRSLLNPAGRLKFKKLL